MNVAEIAVAVAKRCIHGVIALGIAAIPFSSPVSGQTLDDFRTAAAGDGVDVIPFPGLRSTAVSIANEVDREKNEASRYDFSLLERQKNNLLKAIQTTEEEIEAKQEEIEDFREAHPGGSVAPFEDDLEKLKDALSDQQAEVEDMNGDVLEPAIEAWRRLADARGGLREAFEDVLDELDSARSSPERYLGSEPSTEDVDDLKRYIDIIEDEIEVHADAHREQEDGAKGTAEKFWALLSKSQP